MPAQNFLQSSQPESIISLTLSPDYLTSVFGERYAHNWFIENMLLGLYVSTEPSRLLFTKDGQSDISTSGQQLLFFFIHNRSIKKLQNPREDGKYIKEIFFLL